MGLLKTKNVLNKCLHTKTTCDNHTDELLNTVAMAANNLLAIRYSEAIFSAALALNLAEKIENDFDLLQSIIQKESRFILSKVLPRQIKNKIWLAIIKLHKFDKLTVSFLNLLIKNNRLYLLKEIISSYKSKLKRHKGVKDAVLISAVPVSKDIINEITKDLEKAFNDKVEMQVITNPKLLGGFVLKTGSHMLDCSLSTKLEKIKHKVQGVRFN